MVKVSRTRRRTSNMDELVYHIDGSVLYLWFFDKYDTGFLDCSLFSDEGDIPIAGDFIGALYHD